MIPVHASARRVLITAAALLVAAGCDASTRLTSPNRVTLTFPLEVAFDLESVSGATTAAQPVFSVSRFAVVPSDHATGPRYRAEPMTEERARPWRSRATATAQPRFTLDGSDACKIKPGVYAIIDASTNTLVGALIVYQNCEKEIIPA